jgi:hypothetical protein
VAQKRLDVPRPLALSEANVSVLIGHWLRSPWRQVAGTAGGC